MTIILIYIIFTAMYVCICKQVTDRDIHAALEKGACSYGEIRSELGVGTQCGECKQHARQCIRKSARLANESAYSPTTTAVELTPSALSELV